MKQSLVTSAISTISKHCYQNGLSSRGWKKKGNHLYRANEDLFHGIHFQANWYGTYSEGTFTINLVVTAPLLHECWLGKPFPANPATSTFPMATRIGELMSLPEGRADHWWTVTPTTDVDSLSLEICCLLNTVAEHFFESRSNLRALAKLEQLNHKSRVAPLYLAVADYVVGNLDGARRHLLAGIQTRGASDKTAAARFARAAAKLGLKMEGN